MTRVLLRAFDPKAVGWPIPVRDIAASIAISGTANASATYTAALSHHKAKTPAPTLERVTAAAKSVFGHSVGAAHANGVRVAGRNRIRPVYDAARASHAN